MNDLAPILRRVAAINPVPDETDLPANVMSATALLDTIDERTGAVQTQQHHTKTQEGPKRRRTGALVASVAFTIIIVIGGVFTLIADQAEDEPFAAAAQPTTVTGVVISAEDVLAVRNQNSMEDTIRSDSLLTVDRSAYDTDLPERLDIVLYADARDSDVMLPRQLVTRVIGLPGETIEVREGRVYIDDRVLDELYLKNPQVPLLPFGPITLGSDEMWLMGDNRQASGDSDFRGAIAVSLLRGKITEIANP